MLFVEVAGLILSHHLWTVSVSISAIFLEVMEESIFGSFVGFNSKVFSSDLVVFFFYCVVSTLGVTSFYLSYTCETLDLRDENIAFDNVAMTKLCVSSLAYACILDVYNFRNLS